MIFGVFVNGFDVFSDYENKNKSDICSIKNENIFKIYSTTIWISIGSNLKIPNLEPPNLWKIEPRTYRTGVWIFKFKPNLLRLNLEPLIFLKNFLCDIHWAEFLANFFNNIERSIIISRLIHRKMFPFQSKNLWKISPIVLLQKSPNLTKFHVKKVRKGSLNL